MLPGEGRAMAGCGAGDPVLHSDRPPPPSPPTKSAPVSQTSDLRRRALGHMWKTVHSGNSKGVELTKMSIERGWWVCYGIAMRWSNSQWLNRIRLHQNALIWRNHQDGREIEKLIAEQ